MIMGELNLRALEVELAHQKALIEGMQKKVGALHDSMSKVANELHRLRESIDVVRKPNR
jgi:uncharacterized coiled-coil protein SlyX